MVRDLEVFWGLVKFAFGNERVLLFIQVSLGKVQEGASCQNI